jgi:hypothetical protein
LLYSSIEHEKCPAYTGYKVWIAKHHDLQDNEVVCPFVPVQSSLPSEYLLDKLDVGGNYWVSVSLVGVGQESAPSVPVWICLAGKFMHPFLIKESIFSFVLT